MNTRQRFQAVMNFEPFDRLPLVEWAMWWDKTVARWHGEGLPAHIQDRYDLYRHFGLDMYYQGWIRPAVPPAASHGAGVVRDAQEYESLRASLYRPAEPNARLWAQWQRQQRQGEAVVWLTLMGFFWHPRTLLGIEPHLFAFYDQPGLMQRMNEDLYGWNLDVIERVCRVCTPDFMTFAEDMSYNHGPMLSKDLFDEFLKPWYQRLTAELHRRGILVIIDSDGDITTATQWYLEAGADGLLPLERQASVDMANMRQKYRRARFIGHYDKMVMPLGEAAMAGEFERLLPTAARGGFIPSVDHQTPPGVSYQQYLTYLKLYRDFAQQAGAMSRQFAGADAIR